MSDEQPKTKVCKRCGQELPVEYFSKNRATKDGLQLYCKDCQKETMRLARERNATNLLKAHGVVEVKDGREETWEKKSEARATLDVLPDSELLAELRRRGYAGKIYKKIQVIV